jgi:branched-chain amino acid aminotransferase
VRPGRPPLVQKLLASVNGRIGPAREAMVPAQDEGLLRGDGAYEVVRVYLGSPFMLAEHLDRLERSCRVLRLSFPRAMLEREILGLVEAGGPVSRDIRVVLTRAGNRVLLMEHQPQWRPARLAFVTDQPRLVLEGAKSLSYAGNMLARRIAEERGFQEALLVSPVGHVLESQTAAFFWVTPDGVLCTPPLSEGIMNSVSRAIVIEHLPVEEHPCRLADALAADQAFLAGTCREIHPVKVIERRTFEFAPGDVTGRASDLYWKEVEAATGVDIEAHLLFLERDRAAMRRVAQARSLRRSRP